MKITQKAMFGQFFHLLDEVTLQNLLNKSCNAWDMQPESRVASSHDQYFHRWAALKLRKKQGLTPQKQHVSLTQGSPEQAFPAAGTICKCNKAYFP